MRNSFQFQFWGIIYTIPKKIISNQNENLHRSTKLIRMQFRLSVYYIVFYILGSGLYAE